MSPFSQVGNALLFQQGHEHVRVDAWGADSIRVRAAKHGTVADPAGSALLPPPGSDGSAIVISAESATLRNGNLEAQVNSYGRVQFVHALTKRVLLAEPWYHPSMPSLQPPGRAFQAIGGKRYRVEARFKAQAGERFYGLGQHKHGRLDQKGCVIDLVQRNGEVAIPFLVSNWMYGFLWNTPAVGRVELADNGTRWVAEATTQLDYWVTTGDGYRDILRHYADATGHAPRLPEFAAGFWQSKLRYRTQEEVLDVAREYRRRGLPLSVIVIDYFHWPRQGEWAWDATHWPDPAAMVRELKSMGIEVMVSVWPTVNPNGQHAAEMQSRGLLVDMDRGLPLVAAGQDTQDRGTVFFKLYDSTSPDARRYVWDKIKKGYHDIGIRVFWLDGCEPELDPFEHDNIRYHLGAGTEVTNLYPALNAKMIYDGLRAAGEEEIITLCRSAWAGSQRYGAALWSGDIPSTFRTLAKQVRAGLNAAMSGIPWWTTDIGGFFDGYPESPEFRELIVRWFQYGVFCPLFRLHGLRMPVVPGEICGGPNEVWSFGDEAYELIVPILHLRERLRPYLMEQMCIASADGTPPMRPLFYDFPADETCYEVEAQFLFGPDILVCPVTTHGQRRLSVYLPAGAQWRDAWDGQMHAGGQWLEAEAPLARIPVYLKNGASLPISG